MKSGHTFLLYFVEPFPNLICEFVQEEAEHPLGLSKRQRFLLKGQWKGISRELQSTGVNMFVQ